MHHHELSSAGAAQPGPLLSGVLHVFVAFDWGEEVNLELAGKLAPADVAGLARRRRTPASIVYRPAPLRFALAEIALDLPEVDPIRASAEAMVFDFAAVSVGLRIPYSLSQEALTRLAGWLADPEPVTRAVREAVIPLQQRLLPAIRQPLWSQLSEEYFVFQFPPASPLPPVGELLEKHAAWLASLARLEKSPLSNEEVVESLRLRLTYTPDDLLICEWAASVLFDNDCEETLQTIEFANVQLLEFRHIDDRLDQRLEAAYRLIYPLARSWLPFWRTQTRPLRALDELKVEANGLFERTGNALKLVGDQYLARAYRLLGTRFHLDQWERNIRQSLDVVQEVYQVVSDQAATYRTEFLEIIVILLIFFEILTALLRH